MKTFKCALCEKSFPLPDEAVWNHEMALEEYRRLYPGRPVENVSITCDDCHLRVEQWRREHEDGYEPTIQ
jgi:hypothetical protein